MRKLFDLFKGTIQEFLDDGCPDVAAAVAYYTIFAIFPLLIGAVILASLFVDPRDFEGQIVSFLSPRLPVNSDLLVSIVEGVVRGRGPAGVLAVLSLLWSGSNIFAAISTAVNRAWDTPKGRGFLGGQAARLLMLAGAGVLLLVSIGVTALIRVLTQLPISLGGFRLFDNPLASAALSLVPLVFNFAIFLMIYKFVPATRVVWRAAIYGASLAAVLFEIAKYAFTLYVTNFARLDLVYGPIAGLMVLLLWGYLSAVVLLVGAEFSQYYAQRTHAKETSSERKQKPREPARETPAAPEGGGQLPGAAEGVSPPSGTREEAPPASARPPAPSGERTDLGARVRPRWTALAPALAATGILAAAAFLAETAHSRRH